jgi:ribosomal protein S18 acetylase RimI-like enzyme
MEILAGRGEIAQAAALAVPGHPWPAVALAAAIEVRTGVYLPSSNAVAWRGGNPWGPTSDTLHVLGRAQEAAQLVTALAAPGGRVITTPAALTASAITVDRYEWDLRAVDGPLPADDQIPHPGLRSLKPVAWLPANRTTAREINVLLDEAFTHAALRPGDERAGRWCGIRDADDVLVACAAETLPAAPVAHLSALAVLPRARRQHLGATITRFFVAEAFAAGAPKVVLGVDADNPNARALYDRLGFTTWHLAGATLPGEVS